MDCDSTANDRVLAEESNLWVSPLKCGDSATIAIIYSLDVAQGTNVADCISSVSVSHAKWIEMTSSASTSAREEIVSSCIGSSTKFMDVESVQASANRLAIYVNILVGGTESENFGREADILSLLLSEEDSAFDSRVDGASI